MRKIRRGVILAIIIFLVIAIPMCLVNKDEIIFSILAKKDMDIGPCPSLPYSYKYFCTKDKNNFLISKFNDERNATPTLCGFPLSRGDLAWCIFSDTNISEEQFEILMKEFNVDYGFAVFQTVRGDYAQKMKSLAIIGYPTINADEY